MADVKQELPGDLIAGLIFYAFFWLIAPLQWLMDLGT